MSEWIKCSEKMPPADVWVLAHNGKWCGVAIHRTLTDDGYMRASEQWQDEHHEFIDHLGPPVTHWMPLPAPPQEDKT